MNLKNTSILVLLALCNAAGSVVAMDTSRSLKRTEPDTADNGARTAQPTKIRKVAEPDQDSSKEPNKALATVSTSGESSSPVIAPPSVVLIGVDDPQGQHKINVPQAAISLCGALCTMITLVQQGWRLSEKEYDPKSNTCVVNYAGLDKSTKEYLENFSTFNLEGLVYLLEKIAPMSAQETEQYLIRNYKGPERLALLEMGQFLQAEKLVRAVESIEVRTLQLPANLRAFEQYGLSAFLNVVERLDYQGNIKNRLYLPNFDLWKSRHRKIVCDGAVWSLVISPDGKWLVTGSHDKKARILEMATGKVKTEIEHGGGVRSVTISPDGKWLVTGCDDKKARIIEMATGKVKTEIEHGGGVRSVTISPDGKWLVTGSNDTKARIIEMATGSVKKEIEHGNGVVSVAISPNGKWLVTGSDDYNEEEFEENYYEAGNKARIIEMATGAVQKEIELGDWVGPVKISPDGNWLVTAYGDNARIIEMATGAVKKEIKHETGVGVVAISPDGKWLVTGDEDDYKVRIIEMATGEVTKDITNDGTTTSVAFSPDGKWLVVASGHVLTMYDLARPKGYELKALLAVIAANK